MTQIYTIEKEAILSIKMKNGDNKTHLQAVVFTDPDNRHKVFYNCTEMGLEDIEATLKSIAGVEKDPE